MSPLIIASQRDEDFNAVIRERLASLHATALEPLPDGHPLYTYPRVRRSPHTRRFPPLAKMGLPLRSWPT